MSLLEFTCLQCTRRLSRLQAQSSSGPSNNLILRLRDTPPPHLSRKLAPPWTPRRLYGSKGLRARIAPTANSFDRKRFTRADVPPLEFWDTARAPLATDLSADECLQAARTYVDAALKDASGWQRRLIATDDDGLTTQRSSPNGQSSLGRGKGEDQDRGKTLSASTLHYVAVAIVINTADNMVRNIGMHMLHTLTRLDYAPSILTLVRMALRRKQHGSPPLEPAVKGLDRILRRVGDGGGGGGGKFVYKDGMSEFAADACTLRALMYAAEDTREGDNNALRWFRRAYEVDAATAPLKPPVEDGATTAQEGGVHGGANPGGDDDVEGASFNPRWQWKLSFALGVAAIRLKRGETAKALDMYAVAAAELDAADGYVGMVKLLEEMGKADTDEYAAALEKAATSGDQPAAQKMAEREWKRAAEGGLSKWEKRKRQVLAEEWMAIAGIRPQRKDNVGSIG
ncbi:hypothetical protein F5X97DRAFT_879 [Nemania serpens]|nr:hypothetical protein F5X97DRAFT_879 [Nemania serpens]